MTATVCGVCEVISSIHLRLNVATSGVHYVPPSGIYGRALRLEPLL